MYKIYIKRPKWMPGGYVDVINSMGINCVEFRLEKQLQEKSAAYGFIKKQLGPEGNNRTRSSWINKR